MVINVRIEIFVISLKLLNQYLFEFQLERKKNFIFIWKKKIEITGHFKTRSVYALKSTKMPSP